MNKRFRHQSVTALGISDRVFTRVSIRSGRQGLSIRSLGLAMPEHSLPPLAEPERRHVAITEALRTGGMVSRDEPEAVGVNRLRDSKAQITWLPSVDPAELASMAAFEMEKVLPMEAGRYVAGYSVLHTNGREGSDTLLVALDRAAADATTRGAQHAGVVLTRATLGALALVAAWKHGREAGALKAAKPLDTTASEDPQEVGQPRIEMIVHLALDSTDIVILRDDRPVFMRGSSLGLAKMLSRLRQAGIAAALEDLELLDLDHLEFSLMGIREKHLASGGLSLEDEIGLPDADSLAGRATTGLHSIIGNEDEAPTPKADEARLMMDSTRPLDNEAVSRTSQLLALSEDDGTTWGESGAEIVQTWLKKLLQEMKRTIVAAGSSVPSRKLSAVTLCGPGAVFQGIDEFFAKNFQAPAFLLDGFCGLSIDLGTDESLVERLMTLTKKKGAAKVAAAPPPMLPAAKRQLYVEVIGAAIEELEHSAVDVPKLNLLPTWYMETQATGEKRRSMATTAVIGFIALLLAVVYLQLRHSHIQALVEDLERENAIMAPVAAKVKDMEEKLAIVREHVDGRYSALAVMEMLAKLDTVRERRVRLIVFNYERGKDVQIRGHAKAVPDFNDFQIGIDRSGYFSRVDPRGDEPRELSGDRRVREFDLLAKLYTETKARSTSAPAGRSFGGPVAATTRD